MFGISDCVGDCIRPVIPQPTEWQQIVACTLCRPYARARDTLPKLYNDSVRKSLKHSIKRPTYFAADRRRLLLRLCFVIRAAA